MVKVVFQKTVLFPNITSQELFVNVFSIGFVWHSKAVKRKIIKSQGILTSDDDFLWAWVAWSAIKEQELLCFLSIQSHASWDLLAKDEGKKIQVYYFEKNCSHTYISRMLHYSCRRHIKQMLLSQTCFLLLIVIPLLTGAFSLGLRNLLPS